MSAANGSKAKAKERCVFCIAPVPVCCGYVSSYSYSYKLLCNYI